jgi:hypothetical protein
MFLLIFEKRALLFKSPCVVEHFWVGNRFDCLRKVTVEENVAWLTLFSMFYPTYILKFLLIECGRMTFFIRRIYLSMPLTSFLHLKWCFGPMQWESSQISSENLDWRGILILIVNQVNFYFMCRFRHQKLMVSGYNQPNDSRSSL